MLSKQQIPISAVIHRDETLLLKDGVKLKARLWFPKQEGTWPALLMRQPYGREIASTVTYAHPSWWASHGFLVVIQDVRGQGDSSGDFNGFIQEASDTTHTHSWVRSLPECNGILGTYGFSYQGLTQLLALPETPPPDCLIPAMTGLNEAEHWSSEGGAFWWHIGLAWGLQLAAQKVKRLGDKKAWTDIRESLENKRYLLEGPLLLQKYDPNGMAMKWLRESNESNKKPTIHKPLKAWLKQPMLLIGGWWDPHVNGILDIYQQSIESGGKPEIHIGPATHLQWWEGAQMLQLRFFKQHLQKLTFSTSNNSKLHYWNLTTNQWQNPQKEKGELPTWGLRSEGLACLESKEGLLLKNSKGSGMIFLVHDPWRPVPAIGGHLSPEPGASDRSNIDKRSDVITFTSHPFTKTLHIEGKPELEIEVCSNNKGFDLCVALSIIEKDHKKVNQLSTGFLRVLGEQSNLFSIKKVLFSPLSADFNEGTCLRISLAGAAWPAIGINPGDNKSSCGAPGAHCLITTISLNLSKSKLQISPLIPDQGFQEGM
tara:strand:- start:14756 stop:16378 length:1623 start_codon:yes stop_codon:yes gene_type:complete